MKKGWLELEYIPGKENEVIGYAGKLVFATGDQMTVFERVEYVDNKRKEERTRLIFSDQQRLIEQAIKFAKGQGIELLYVGKFKDKEPKRILYCVDGELMQSANALFKKYLNICVLQEIAEDELQKTLQVKQSLITSWGKLVN